MKLPNFLPPAFRFKSLIVGLLLVLLAPAANAVTKHLSMVGENGQPMVSTAITITSPDGSKVEEGTDDKGILTFDFKQSGTYTLSDPAGNVIKTISIQSAGMSTKAMVITGVAAGAVALLALGSSGGDSSSSDAPPVETEPPVTEPPVTDPPDDGGGTEQSQAGTYNVNLSVASNPANQPVLLSQLVLQLEIIGTALTIIQLSNNENFPAQMSGTIVDTSISASSNGVYGESTTLFQLAGSVSTSQVLNFILNIGADGSLPDGQAIIYNGTGTKQ